MKDLLRDLTAAQPEAADLPLLVVDLARRRRAGMCGYWPVRAALRRIG